MDNVKNDQYYLNRIKTDIAFIVNHIDDINGKGRHQDG